MLSFRRALLIALALLTLFLFFRSSDDTPSSKRPIKTDNTSGVREEADTRGHSGVPPEPQHGGQHNAAGTREGGLKTQKGSPSMKPDLSERPLTDQLAYYFPYNREEKFPAFIWQTWKYTPASGEFGDNFRPAEASWTELHPTFVHEVITDNVAVHLIRYLYSALPQVIEAYEALPLPVLKADFFRYLILLARGGIYTDIDTFAIKPATDWVPQEVNRTSFGLVIGIEADPDRPDWHQWYSRRIQFCQWTIQSKPGHPVLRDIVVSITQETLYRLKAGKLDRSDRGIVEFTGPAVWTDKVFAYFNDARYFDIPKTAAGKAKSNVTWESFTGMTAPKQVGDVVVLPITGFSPGVRQMGSEEPDHPSACVKHEFEGTWKPESERNIGKEQN